MPSPPALCVCVQGRQGQPSALVLAWAVSFHLCTQQPPTAAKPAEGKRPESWEVRRGEVLAYDTKGDQRTFQTKS